MNKIRKIWIGNSIKNDSMSWEIGQKVWLNRDRTDSGEIAEILKSEEGHEIYVKQKNLVRLWKSTTMKATIEYDLSF